MTIGGVSLDDNAKTVTVDGDTVNLTPLEYDILWLLMQHPGKVFSPHEIYRRVWHEDPAADNPVAVHVRHIREKIEVDPSNPRYVTVVWGKGIRSKRGMTGYPRSAHIFKNPRGYALHIRRSTYISLSYEPP